MTIMTYCAIRKRITKKFNVNSEVLHFPELKAYTLEQKTISVLKKKLIMIIQIIQKNAEELVLLLTRMTLNIKHSTAEKC